MSFFNTIVGGVPDEPEPTPIAPPWFGPPIGVLPTAIPDRAVVFRNEQALLTIDHLNVFPEGMQFSLNLWVRDGNELWEMPWELHQGRSSPDDPEYLRLGVEFSDGAKWTNLPGILPSFEEEPKGPVVFPQGGGGGGNHWRMEHWMWPLPTPGKLTVHAAWPAYGVYETSATLDATRIIEAAANAEIIWPDSQMEGSSG